MVRCLSVISLSGALGNKVEDSCGHVTGAAVAVALFIEEGNQSLGGRNAINHLNGSLKRDSEDISSVKTITRYSDYELSTWGGQLICITRCVLKTLTPTS